jgi:hypothetical protein
MERAPAREAPSVIVPLCHFPFCDMSSPLKVFASKRKSHLPDFADGGFLNLSSLIPSSARLLCV